jgi:hypothetical protein
VSTYQVTAKALVALLSGSALLGQVLTSQYDNARTSANTREIILTPANVNSRQFGKTFSYKVDGDVYAQPLYLPHVPIPGKGTHNVVYVATEHDSVYAFDADGRSAEPLWHASFLGSGVRTVTASDVGCPFISPQIGITSTPAIDLASGTLYVLARTKEDQGFFADARFVQRLHALAITTGVEKLGGPIEIQASVARRLPSGASGAAAFNPLAENPQAGLLVANGQVYLTWGSSCDIRPYHGWVMAYDAKTLKQTAVFNTSPDSGESGIWQSHNGPAADEQGNVYVLTGNGEFNAAADGRDYGDTILKLRIAGRAFEVADYFTPYNEDYLNSTDLDLGSGGPVLLPKQPGDRAHLLLGGGKQGALYVLDRDQLGKIQPGRDTQAINVLRFRAGLFSAPAYWNRNVYVLASDDFLYDLPLEHGAISFERYTKGTQHFGLGATPAISANGRRDGIVWLIESKPAAGRDQPAVLHAYDAANVERELYNSEQQRGRDRAEMTLRFTVPTVANGRVYVPARGEVDVYGLLRR